MTITASYVLLSILAVPALVELGVPLLSAHLMILWLSQDASLTPPFALGAFIAAGIAISMLFSELLQATNVDSLRKQIIDTNPSWINPLEHATNGTVFTTRVHGLQNNQ